MGLLMKDWPGKYHPALVRSLQLLKHDKAYALGAGNSVPEYVPDENYFAMIRAALDLREER